MRWLRSLSLLLVATRKECRDLSLSTNDASNEYNRHEILCRHPGLSVYLICARVSVQSRGTTFALEKILLFCLRLLYRFLSTYKFAQNWKNRSHH